MKREDYENKVKPGYAIPPPPSLKPKYIAFSSHSPRSEQHQFQYSPPIVSPPHATIMIRSTSRSVQWCVSQENPNSFDFLYPAMVAAALLFHKTLSIIITFFLIIVYIAFSIQK